MAAASVLEQVGRSGYGLLETDVPTAVRCRSRRTQARARLRAAHQVLEAAG